MKYLKDVARFMTAMGDGHRIGSKPKMISVERSALRHRLQQEELKEYEDADNIIDIADALADQLYILMGTVLEHGLADKFDAIWDEVQESNMSKVCKPEEIPANIMRYEKDGVPVLVREIEGNSVLVRRSDGKILKPLNYYPVNLKPIIFDGESPVLINREEEEPVWRALGGSEVSSVSGLEIKGEGVLVKTVFRSAPKSLVNLVKGKVETITLHNFIPDAFIVEEVDINGEESKFSIVLKNGANPSR